MKTNGIKNHKKKIINWKFLPPFIFVMLIALNFLCAQQLQPLSAELIAKSPLNIIQINAEKNFFFFDNNKIKQSSFKTTLQDSVAVFAIETISPSTNHFNVQAGFKSGAAVKKGDIILARFSIRAIYAKQETGDGLVSFFINQSLAPFERNILVDISCGPEWKTIEIPFKAQYDMSAGNGTIGFTFGALAQKVELASVQVLNFETKVTLDQLPITRFTYKGREENAPWRNAALQRIEEIRTAPFQIKIVDKNKNPIKGAIVHVEMIQSEFIWGTAANEALLANDLPNSANYRKYLKDFFNTGIIENGFKAGRWQAKPETKPETMSAFDWLDNNGFRLRGHNLVWPGWKFNSPLFRTTAEKDTSVFRLLVEDDIE
jgi:hypothetical protein